ncbi:uncharacterized protein [Hoplias malabaricus]|uniref:uncharacterized protein isoform X2 n=1 Tax=Hoplias malabaricus TaxID=27720 RepID=UPI003461F481
MPRSTKYLTIVSGNTLDVHKKVINLLHKARPGLKPVTTVEKCDVILVFCPIVSRAGTDINDAVQQLNDVSAVKPAVLVVLHQTLNPDVMVPESRKCVTRKDTLTVDCLFSEDRGFLSCPQNNSALKEVTNRLKIVKRTKSKATGDGGKAQQSRIYKKKGSTKYLTIVSGNTLDVHKKVINLLHKARPELKPVTTVEECDVILVFCPIVSRAGTDINGAVQQLNDVSAVKPAVLVVLHQTLNPDVMVPESRICVTRKDTLTVDCLFSEDRGFLSCPQNNSALKEVTDRLKIVKRTKSKGDGGKAQQSRIHKKKEKKKRQDKTSPNSDRPSNSTSPVPDITSIDDIDHQPTGCFCFFKRGAGNSIQRRIKISPSH